MGARALLRSHFELIPEGGLGSLERVMPFIDEELIDMGEIVCPYLVCSKTPRAEAAVEFRRTGRTPEGSSTVT
eukprot:12701678-Alexandrium_andersonii.AAC.1